LDTSILGAPEEIYEVYSRAIRKEYSWVPDVLYREGRMKILNDFLGRERIYHTEEIRAKYETQARHNIAGEMRALAVISRISKCQKPIFFASRHRELTTDASSAIHPATNPAKAKGEETFDH